MSETLNERIYQEEPTIAGVKVRAYSNAVKLKLGRVMRWIEDHDSVSKNEEILYAFIYLIAAPIERVAINTGNMTQYLVDKEKFLAQIADDDLKKAAEWFITVTNLEKETEIVVVPKPGSSIGETPPPNL